MSKLLLVFRLFDPTYGSEGNPKTLTVRLNDDRSLGYHYYSGWQSQGMGFSISNMQMTESLPMTVRGVTSIEKLQAKVQYALDSGCGVSVKDVEIINDLTAIASLSAKVHYTPEEINTIRENALIKGFEAGRGLTKDGWEQSDWESFKNITR